MHKRFFFFLLVLVIGASCTRYKDIVYVRDLGKTTSDSLIKTTYTTYKVQASDILYIKIRSSINPTAAEIFNKTSSTSENTYYYNTSNYYLIGYPVDLGGYINIAVLGDIKVAGLTMKEIEQELQNKAREIVSDAEVVVRLLSFKITVLGEIGSGQKNIMAERANLFEVFAMSGDILKSGNKHNVLIMRTTPEGIKTFRVDVTDKNLISSPLFYVQPNDIIYVEPAKITAVRLTLNELALFITSVSSVVTLSLLVYNLVQK
ncbi:MAG TPA: polysaccharide biosynthesis/export family protein [Bacteroidales bacterium]|nr:polysaccharide biosynthesis/export family protein [Bacteroidales bacterium]